MGNSKDGKFKWHIIGAITGAIATPVVLAVGQSLYPSPGFNFLKFPGLLLITALGAVWGMFGGGYYKSSLILDRGRAVKKCAEASFMMVAPLLWPVFEAAQKNGLHGLRPFLVPAVPFVGASLWFAIRAWKLAKTS